MNCSHKQQQINIIPHPYSDLRELSVSTVWLRNKQNFIVCSRFSKDFLNKVESMVLRVLMGRRFKLKVQDTIQTLEYTIPLILYILVYSSSSAFPLNCTFQCHHHCQHPLL